MLPSSSMYPTAVMHDNNHRTIFKEPDYLASQPRFGYIDLNACEKHKMAEPWQWCLPNISASKHHLISFKLQKKTTYNTVYTKRSSSRRGSKAAHFFFITRKLCKQTKYPYLTIQYVLQSNRLILTELHVILRFIRYQRPAHAMVTYPNFHYNNHPQFCKKKKKLCQWLTWKFWYFFY